MTSPTGPRRKNRRALTLIEVLVSVVILATGAVLLMQSLAQAAHAHAIADAHAQAYLFAASKLGELELAAVADGALPEREEGRFRIEQRAFEWVVTAAFQRELEPVLAVALTVSWQQGEQPYEYRLETLIRVPDAAESGA